MIDQDLNVSRIHLSDNYKLEVLFNIADQLDISGVKVRTYDKILNFATFNPSTSHLFLSFLHLSSNQLFSLTSRTPLQWTLPASPATALCAHLDQDTLLLAYDSNHITAFDLLNHRLHDWSRKYGNAFPSNFLNRYNRYVGITQLANTKKYIVYTNYTYCLVNLGEAVPLTDVEIV